MLAMRSSPNHRQPDSELLSNELRTRLSLP